MVDDQFTAALGRRRGTSETAAQRRARRREPQSTGAHLFTADFGFDEGGRSTTVTATNLHGFARHYLDGDLAGLARTLQQLLNEPTGEQERFDSPTPPSVRWHGLDFYVRDADELRLELGRLYDDGELTR